MFVYTHVCTCVVCVVCVVCVRERERERKREGVEHDRERGRQRTCSQHMFSRSLSPSHSSSQRIAELLLLTVQ